MEVISTPYPVSWEDGGLDWESPDPADFRYYAAIREAILERSLAADYDPDYGLLREIQPYHVLSADLLQAVGDYIYLLSRHFIDMQAEDWTPVLDRYPVTRQGRLPVGADRGALIGDARTWFRQAREELDQMRYLYLRSTVQSYHKQAHVITASGNEKPALEQYAMSMSEMAKEWENKPWSGPSSKDSDMGMLAYYQEYYAYYFNNPDWAKGNPYWVESSAQSTKCRYTPVIAGGFQPDIFIYAMTPKLSGANVLMFDPSQAFPNDEIVQDKYCRLTNYTRDGDAIDFAPAFGKQPLDPPHSMVDYSIPGEWVDTAGVYYAYTSVLRGIWLEDLRLIGDFYSENGFRFKPAKEI